MLAASSSKALWYTTRATGMVSLVLLTVSVALGVAELVRFATPRWPRFVVAALHRNVALLATVFLCVHIASAVADSFATIRLVDVFVPFVGSYRPIWLGLGTVAFDLILALVVTSLLRERLGHRAWRAVHWAAYAAWPVALVHGLGTGTDTRVRWAVIINVACLAAVLVAVLTRVGWTRTASGGWRVVAVTASVTIAVGVAAWMMLEPMRPGWARKAGTPTALLAASRPVSSRAAAGGLAIPFSGTTRGSIRQTESATTGLATLTIDTVVPTASEARVHVVIEGTPLARGGVDMRRGSVRLGPAGEPNLYRGRVVSLDGSRVLASVHAGDGSAVTVSMNLSIDAGSNRVRGTVSVS